MAKSGMWGAAFAAAIAGIFFTPSCARAEWKEPYPDYEKYRNTPVDMLHILEGQSARDAYLERVAEAYKEMAADGAAISKADIERAIRTQGQSGTLVELRDLAIKSYDADNDGRASREEVEAFVLRRQYGGKMPETGNRKNNFDLKIAEIMGQDTNRDGFIDAQDVVRPRADGVIGMAIIMHEQMFLRPLLGKEDPITIQSLQNEAAAVFDSFDSDGDGVLSDDEQAKMLWVYQKRAGDEKVKWLLSTGRCVLPKVADGVSLKIVPSITGGAMSSVAIQDDTKPTYAAEVVIDADAPPLYLVLASYMHPSVWRVTGAVDRLAQVVVLAPDNPAAQKRYAAIAGVPKDRVYFAGLHDCAHDIGTELRRTGGFMDETVRIIEGAAGAKAEVGAIRGPLVRAQIGAAGITVRAQRDITIGDAPAGYDPKVWRDYVQTFKQYLVKFSPEELAEIVTELPLIPYAVEPAGYGFAKLVHDGVVVPEPSGKKVIIIRYESGSVESKSAEHPKPTFPNTPITSTEERESMNWRVVRPMPQYPPMDYEMGGMFILEKGIPMPGGETYKCVMSEETGKPLAAAYRCPKE
ncbi:MAG: EF-hand domain-containing protein [Alphaproteobacteria bacterium]|nr:EF-hand domain-containing protein [Alphaproteobacteria bacterium]